MKRSFLSMLIVLMLICSMLSIEQRTAEASESQTYIGGCVSFASYLKVKTNNVTELMSYPCKTSTSSSSYVVKRVTKDTTLTSYTLYRNTIGEYWYKVIFYGTTCYVNAADVTVTNYLYSDISIQNVKSPSSSKYGSGFGIGGDISTTYNIIESVSAKVYPGTNLAGSPVIQSSDNVNAKSYSLKSSTVDNELIFNNLAAGSYTYVVSADVKNYYVDTSGALAQNKQTIVLDTSACIVTNSASPNPITAKGIDVSKWQGAIDWATVKSQIDFAIIRCGYGYTGVDGYWATNATACENQNIPYGAYLYSYATSVEEAKKEADHVLSLLSGYDVKLPVFYDLEDSSVQACSKETILEIAKTFCGILEEAGYETGIYANTYWFNTYLTDSTYNSWTRWLAQYASSVTYTGGYRIWQYSDEGSISGISGNVDMNYWYGDFPYSSSGSSDTSYLSKCTFYPSELEIQTTTSATLKQYPCYYATDNSSYDVQTVAAKETFQVTGIYYNTAGEYWYQVKYGEKSAYLDSKKVQVIAKKYDNIYIRNAEMATNISQGEAYNIKGQIESRYSKIYKITTTVYAGENTEKNPVLQSSETKKVQKYALYRSNVDSGLYFNNLAVGKYTYEVAVNVINYYVNGSNSLSCETKKVVLMSVPFTVGGSVASHTHTVVTDEGTSASCTQEGLTQGSHCSECGEIITLQETIEKTKHTEATAVKENIKEDGSYDLVVYCTDCKTEISRQTIVAATLKGVLQAEGITNALEKTIGSSVKLEASAEGGSGTYTYRFAVLNADTGVWYVLRDFGSQSSYTYNLNYPGKKIFAVTIKDSNGKTVATNRLEVNVTIPLAATLQAEGVTDTLNKTIGSELKLDVKATGGSGEYTYRFAVLNADTGVWYALRDFGSQSSYTYKLSYPGKKVFAVTVKDSNGKTVATNRLTVEVK